MSMKGRDRRHHRRFAAGGNGHEQRDPHDIAEIERLQQRIHFIGEFERMRMRCDTTEDDEQVIAWFLGCLRPEIADVVSLQQYYSFSYVFRLAYRVEQQLASKYKQASRFPSSHRVSTAAPTNPRDGPIKADPQGAATPPAGQSNTLRCPLSRSRGAPSLLPVAKHSVVGPDDDTTWLPNNIFWTKCTAKCKVCTVIMDGGSCENMVATSMVEKLGLPTQDHPTPYQLTWLKKGNLIKVTHKCLVQFSIGNKYTDEDWCEVIPMDACHVLLGRPWLYNRRAKHDGYRNTYSFKKMASTLLLHLLTQGMNLLQSPPSPRLKSWVLLRALMIQPFRACRA
ncbi:hypothetical protein OSB04_un001363 [Centaurea solstitialis]|uniref:Uncharacterized protein n=1 Tax=Centaurea solstitialis TaxID=347529 RepID=A0AA38VQY6_9ASTR|nr:hypothetical protein OSB04_un001363 [Centaurea solstitialis]